MFSIGEFSRMSGLSVKTLRYYDDIGLVKPDRVSRESGYRYYSATQLRKVVLINRLKFYGFSLEEVKRMTGLEPKAMDKELALRLLERKEEMEGQIQAGQFVLEQIERDLSGLGQGTSITACIDRIEVEPITLEPVNILSFRGVLDSREYKKGYGAYFAALYEKIVSNKLTPAGTPMTIFHSMEQGDGMDMEFAIPVAEADAEAEGVRAMAPGFCGKAKLKGPYHELVSVYARTAEWMEAGGWEFSASPFEVYVTDPITISSPEELVTEVYVPVRMEKESGDEKRRLRKEKLGRTEVLD